MVLAGELIATTIDGKGLSSIKTFRLNRKINQRAFGKAQASEMFVSHALLASVDPFHSEAQGARLPDDSTYPAIPYSATSRNLMTSGANGSAAMVITPLLTKNSITPAVTPTAAGVVDWTSPTYGDVTNFSTINSSYQNFRHVAWGVRIVANSAVSTTAGMLYGCYFPNNYSGRSSPGNLPTSPDQILALPWSFIIPCSELNNGAVIFPSRRLDPSSTRYRSCDYPGGVVAVGDIEMADGWGSWVFILTGASTVNATSLLVEFVSRGEYTPKPSVIFATGTTYPANSREMDKIVNITSEMPTFFNESNSPNFLRSVIGGARKSLSIAGDMMGQIAMSRLIGGAVKLARTTNWVREQARPSLIRYPGY